MLYGVRSVVLMRDRLLDVTDSVLGVDDDDDWRCRRLRRLLPLVTRRTPQKKAQYPVKNMLRSGRVLSGPLLTSLMPSDPK